MTETYYNSSRLANMIYAIVVVLRNCLLALRMPQIVHLLHHYLSTIA